jgi:hypothetical protein
MAVLKRKNEGKGSLLAIVAAAFLVLSWAPRAYAQPSSAPESAPEYEVKAAFLYHFAKFVEWPSGAFPDSSTPITLCVMDGDPFGKAIESIRGKTVKGRAIVVRQCKEIRDIATCQILFIHSMEKKRLIQVLDSTMGYSILTVGEGGSFAQLGGIINFVIVENKISFQVNVDAAKRAGLEISSKLLKLAEIVKDRP